MSHFIVLFQVSFLGKLVVIDLTGIATVLVAYLYNNSFCLFQTTWAECLNRNVSFGAISMYILERIRTHEQYPWTIIARCVTFIVS